MSFPERGPSDIAFSGEYTDILKWVASWLGMWHLTMVEFNLVMLFSRPPSCQMIKLLQIFPLCGTFGITYTSLEYQGVHVSVAAIVFNTARIFPGLKGNVVLSIVSYQVPLF